MRVRVENVKTIVVTMFDEGNAISDIAKTLGLSPAFVRESVLEWWVVKGEREWEEEKRRRDSL